MSPEDREKNEKDHQAAQTINLYLQRFTSELAESAAKFPSTKLVSPERQLTLHQVINMKTGEMQGEAKVSDFEIGHKSVDQKSTIERGGADGVDTVRKNEDPAQASNYYLVDQVR